MLLIFIKNYFNYVSTYVTNTTLFYGIMLESSCYNAHLKTLVCI